MKTYSVTYKNNFARNITRITARDEQHLIKKLDMMCIDESQVVSFYEVV